MYYLEGLGGKGGQHFSCLYCHLNILLFTYLLNLLID